MLLDRRQTILGLSSLLAAPAIARASSLMPLSPLINPEWITEASFTYSGDNPVPVGCAVQFADRSLSSYRYGGGFRRVMRQMRQQMRMTDFLYSRPVRASFSPAWWRTDPILVAENRLSLLRDPDYQFLLEHETPSAREGVYATVKYDHFHFHNHVPGHEAILAHLADAAYATSGGDQCG